MSGELEELDVPDYGVVSMRHFRAKHTPRERVRKQIKPLDMKEPKGEEDVVDDDVYVMVFSHGNACNVDGMMPLARAMCHALEMDVVLYDYPGYGGNPSRSSEEGAFAAAHAAFAYAERIAGSPRRVFVFGHSLGTGPSMELATQHECAGLILQSPIRSALRVPLPNLMCTPWFDIMANEDKVDLLNPNLPLFVLHGKKDETIRVSHGKVMADRARIHMRKVTSWWPSSMDHNNVHTHADYYKHLGEFITKAKGI